MSSNVSFSEGEVEQNLDALIEVFENSSDAIIMLNDDQQIIHFNRSAEKIFDYKRSEILGEKLEVLLPTQIQAHHRKQIQNFASQGVGGRRMGERSVLYGKSKSGDLVPLDIAIQYHGNSKHVKYSAICRDITHRLHRKNLLEEQKLKFEALFNTSNRYLFLLSLDGEILDANTQAQSLLNDHRVKSIFDSIEWSDAGELEQFRKALKTLTDDMSSELIVSVKTQTGDKLRLDTTAKLFSVTSGSQFILFEATNITELADKHAALQRSEKHLAHAQEISHVGNWVWDIESGNLEWSDEVYNIFDQDPKANTASYPNFLNAIHPDDRAKVENAVASALNDNEPYDITHRLVSSDGALKTVRERGEILRDDFDLPIQMIGTVQDITEDWERERELERARLQAEDANIAKTQFLATMSHELRTPLNSIIGFSEIMVNEIHGAMKEDYKEYATYIKTSGKYLLSILNDVLDIARIEKGNLELNFVEISPEYIIRHTDRIMRTTIEAKGLNLLTNCPTDIASLRLDEKRITQCILNLLNNSLKFTEPGGSIALRVRQTPTEIVFSIKDTGIGISDADLKKIFDPFFQVDMGLNRAHEGVGLGLAIVKQFVEKQNGRVEVTSKLNGGTSISLHFPKN